MADVETVGAARVVNALRDQYIAVRVLPDGSVAALGDLLFTRAIFLGCTEYGFERRFCFGDRTLATQRFFDLQSEDDVPEGFTARRGA